VRQTRDWSEEIYEDVQPLPDYQPASPHGLAVLSWRRPLMIAPAARVIDAEIVLRVLIEILGGNSIAARRRFACQGATSIGIFLVRLQRLKPFPEIFELIRPHP
jgi:hypothetical protein